MRFLFRRKNKNKRNKKTGKGKGSKFASTEITVSEAAKGEEKTVTSASELLPEKSKKNVTFDHREDNIKEYSPEDRDGVFDFRDVEEESVDSSDDDEKVQEDVDEEPLLNSYNSNGAINGSEPKHDPEAAIGKEATPGSFHLATVAADAANMATTAATDVASGVLKHISSVTTKTKEEANEEANEEDVIEGDVKAVEDADAKTDDKAATPTINGEDQNKIVTDAECEGKQDADADEADDDEQATDLVASAAERAKDEIKKEENGILDSFYTANMCTTLFGSKM